MKTFEGSPPAGQDRREIVLLRLEATDHEGWQLSQMDGRTLLKMPMTFTHRSDAVNFAKERCSAVGCHLIIRPAKRLESAA